MLNAIIQKKKKEEDITKPLHKKEERPYLSLLRVLLITELSEGLTYLLNENCNTGIKLKQTNKQKNSMMKDI